MSDFLRHECGIAMIRLRKPLEYYYDRYKSPLYPLEKLFVLMEKQYHRGHDGMGIGAYKMNMPHGQSYLFRRRSAERDSLARVFQKEMKTFNKLERRGVMDAGNPASVKKHYELSGELLLGHLRYGTSGAFSEGSCHPYVRRSNWPTKTLMVMGNFNMTNARELTNKLVERGQHPVFGTDTQTVLEEIKFHLDEHHTDLYRELRDEGVPGRDIPEIISKRLDVAEIVRESAGIWDGGYAIAGLVGNGDAFVMRDPCGIRPCHYYMDDEVIAFASERVPLMTVFDARTREVGELPPGTVAVIKHDGSFDVERFAPEQKHKHCSFERIYFSRGNDPEIYRERKKLGKRLVPQLLKSMDDRLEKAVVSFIPNTAETAYYGVMDGLRIHRRKEVKAAIHAARETGKLDDETIDDLILNNWPRGEKIAHKDIKMRTFISQEQGRAQMVSHVYDITYGVVNEDDTLVVIDDSIVRGTTLKKSIIQILARTRPRKIVVGSTAPQIRYPDCYGIDMSELGKFIAFQAAIDLLRSRGMNHHIADVYDACQAELRKETADMHNCVQAIYKPFSPEEISAQISEIVYPRESAWRGELEVVFQTIENLHASLPKDCGDWYFTGNYPTPGGYRVVNQAFVHFYEKRAGRVYDLL